MSKFFFSRRFNFFDMICVATGVHLTTTNHWIAGTAVVVIGAVLSVICETIFDADAVA